MMRVKRPILLIVLAGFLVVFEGSLPTGLGAAEIWNSQRKASTPSGRTTIYNKPKNSGVGREGTTTLYNRQSQGNVVARSGKGLQARIDAYKKVDRSNQVPSKLWPLMSTLARENRQADIDQALQREYERKRATAQVMAEMLREADEMRLKAEREHQENLARYNMDKVAYEAEQQAKKMQALKGDVVYASESADDSSYAPGGVQETRDVLKKPKRLFNDPNR